MHLQYMVVPLRTTASIHGIVPLQEQLMPLPCAFSSGGHK